MAKPLAGKRWFEAMGRRASSKGLAALHGRQDRQRWPMWARQAYAAGWLRQQHSRRQGGQECER